MRVLPGNNRIELLGLTREELREFMVSLGEKPYRAQQVYEAIYRRRNIDFEGMTDLGIYLLDGDNLKICFSGSKRPTEFVTKPKSGTALIVLKRLKP